MRKIPIGVALLGFLMLVEGVAGVFWGMLAVGVHLFDLVPSGTGVAWIGAFAIIVGIIQIAVGLAAWQLKPWAWVFGWVMSVVGLFSAFFALLATGSVAYGLAVAFFPLVVYWYINQPDIKREFSIPSGSPSEM